MSLRDYLFLDKLGEGAYSTVWKVKRNSDQTVFALKKVRMSKLGEKEKRNALNEVRILSSIESPFVIRYQDAFFDDDTGSLCLVMEYAPGGDLLQSVQTCQKVGNYLNESFLWTVITSITQGLKALHDQNIMHRDLKSANVFLMSGSQVKLGDMNVSKVAKEGMMHTQTGTPYYASPEVWKDSPYGIKSDIWSLGCVIYEAAALRPPFQAQDMQSLFQKVTKGQYLPLPSHYSPDLEAVVGAMIQVNPAHRPSCDQILRMPAVARHVTQHRAFYERARMAHSLPQAFNEINDKIMHETTTKSTYRERLNSRNPRVQATPSSLGQTPLNVFHSRSNIMKENFGALRLPKLRTSHQMPVVHPAPERRPAQRPARPSWWG